MKYSISWKNVEKTLIGLIVLSVLGFCGALGVKYQGQEAGFQSQPLRPGEIVRHKLHKNWRGIVLWNAKDRTIAVRWYDERKFPGHSEVWTDTLDVEWERE